MSKTEILKLIYIVDFPVEGSSGKNKATREKAAALSKLLGKDNFVFFHPDQATGTKRIVKRILLDFKVFYKMIWVRDITVVQRVFFMPLSRLLFFLKGVKVISEFHADFKEEIPYLNKNKFQQDILKLISPIYELNYYLSDGIIYNHPYLKDKYDGVYKKPSIFSYNGANIQDFTPIDQKQARKLLSIPNDGRIIFLFLGSVSQWHGVDDVISIFNEEVIRKNTNIFLYIVGAKENEYVSELKKSVLNDNVIFFPPVPTMQASQYINASDLCLLPVKQIRTSPGSPLKLYDYISCGKPVITQSNLAGYSDEVERYQLGYVIDFSDFSTAADQLCDIAVTFKENDFKENNIMTAHTMVSWDIRMMNWLEFAKKIVK